MPRLLAVSLITFFISQSSAADRPLPPAEAPKAMTLPKGFQAILFAGEPDVVQPIAAAFDDRGRLWVVECLSYPKWIENGEGKDRVIVFEDTDNDGKFDKRTVVFDKGTNLTGIELGFGGVWLCSIPNLLFVPCDFNADTPKFGKPEAVLDGWSMKCKHNVFNSLTWGPDGWLYGCNGIIDLSKVGKPGTPDKDRIPMNCGVWRYHPTRKVFEPFAHGTTNPFGLDFDEYGECFITNCVIGHLWHMIPGGHYERMYGEDLNKNTYSLMPQTADHIHWGGGNWTTSRGGKGIHSEAGGGHAHVGCMIYLGDNWPDQYRNGAFMLNLHGNRINHDRLERKGSGYVGKHEPDFMLANDEWFRGIFIKYGPDGGVYVSDWTDTGECHNYQVVDPTNGRIYKITYEKPKAWTGNIAALSDAELIELQTHKNDWQVRHARRVLHERAAANKIDAKTIETIRKKLSDSGEGRLTLRYFWTLLAVDPLVGEMVPSLMINRDERVRAWAFRNYLQSELGDRSGVAFSDAFESASPVVRLAVAAALQQQPPSKRYLLLRKLVKHGEDSGDANLPLMIWYAAAPLVDDRPDLAAVVATESKISLLRRYIVRRLAEQVEQKPENGKQIIKMLLNFSEDVDRLIVLQGMEEGMRGRRQVKMFEDWPSAYAQLQKSTSLEVRRSAMKLAVIFGDSDAVAALIKLVRDRSTSTETRYDALQALLIQQKPEMQSLLRDLLEDPAMRGSAIRGLAAFKNDETPKTLLAIYPKLSEKDKEDVVQTLASRPTWALILLDAIEAKQVQRADVSMYVARQIQSLKDKKVQARLAEVWGQIKPASQAKVELTAKYKKMLTPEYLKTADLSKGRLVFSKNCASCHRLYDDGGNIGPALTGSQRHNLDYVLENIIDPSAVVAREYQMTKVETLSGRTITGIIKQETDKALTIQLPNEVVILPKDEIENRSQSQMSMMPEGALEKLTNEEIRDLVAYLASKDQVPLPK